MSQSAGEALLGHFPNDVTFQLGRVSLPTSLSVYSHFLFLSSCSASGMLFQDLWNMICFFPPQSTFVALPSLGLAAKIRPVYSIHWRQTNVTLNKNSYKDEEKCENISVHADRLLCCDLSGTETSSQFTSWYHTTAVIRSCCLPPLLNQAWVCENTRAVKAQTWLCGDHRSTSALQCVGRRVPWYLLDANPWLPLLQIHPLALVTSIYPTSFLTSGVSLLWQREAVYTGTSAAHCYFTCLGRYCDIPNDRCVS